MQTAGSDEVQQLQRALLDYLDDNVETEPSLVVSGVFTAVVRATSVVFGRT